MKNKYKLIKLNSQKEKTFKVTIVADSNDADYITTINTYTEKEFNEYVVDDLIDLLNNYNGSHQLENYSGEAEVPYSDWGRCHTLESVDISCTDENGNVFNVMLNLE